MDVMNKTKAAEELGVSRPTIYSWLESGALSAVGDNVTMSSINAQKAAMLRDDIRRWRDFGVVLAVVDGPEWATGG